jgi:hypothetical protein
LEQLAKRTRRCETNGEYLSQLKNELASQQEIKAAFANASSSAAKAKPPVKAPLMDFPALCWTPPEVPAEGARFHVVVLLFP